MSEFFTRFDGSDATVEILVMLLVAFLLGMLYKWLGCTSRSALAADSAAEPTMAKRTGAPAAAAASTVAATAPAAVTAASEPEPPAPTKDDLKVIEGIGPKSESALNQGDIQTYNKLANTEVPALRQLLDEAGPEFKVVVPDTWPEQARLADEGKWDELKEYQEYLVGGVDPAKAPGAVTEAPTATDDVQGLMSDIPQVTEELKTPSVVEEVPPGENADKALDDLKIVEGIGPKIEELLKDAGIVDLTVLSETDPEELKSILSEAGSRFQMHDPSTWPDQAKLAATGKWDELKEFQDLLQGGRA